ncbi:MAG: hypothetical protein ABI680_02110 [Chthoniobacteraceae bacterium]
MKRAFLSAATVITAVLLFSKSSSFGKDKAIRLQDAPAGVQATIKKVTDAGATFEKVELEEESGGAQYGAKITDKNGLRWEIIMSADGKVLKTQQKKPKK